MSSILRRASTRAWSASARAADDALAVAGAACLAVASGFVSPAGPWLVAGLFLIASAASGKRGRA